ncbi:hypothetical protein CAUPRSCDRAFT_11641 [Caulochytrium protostelioides]|uniref:Uncharacterized protein n=1 Tax=Caulochytrium protostelioides TaxID=1555241 RepID=A0A4P9WTP5_9FUNG|nr:hypothetical protein CAUPRSCDRAFT_11641 [Caulochytrium protostelioides]
MKRCVGVVALRGRRPRVWAQPERHGTGTGTGTEGSLAPAAAPEAGPSWMIARNHTRRDPRRRRSHYGSVFPGDFLKTYHADGSGPWVLAVPTRSTRALARLSGAGGAPDHDKSRVAEGAPTQTSVAPSRVTLSTGELHHGMATLDPAPTPAASPPLTAAATAGAGSPTGNPYVEPMTPQRPLSMLTTLSLAVLPPGPASSGPPSAIPAMPPPAPAARPVSFSAAAAAAAAATAAAHAAANPALTGEELLGAAAAGDLAVAPGLALLMPGLAHGERGHGSGGGGGGGGGGDSVGGVLITQQRETGEVGEGDP